MPLPLLLSMILLGWSPTGFCYQDASLGDIVRNLTAHAFMDDVTHSAAHQEIRSGHQQTLQELRSGQEQTLQEIRSGQGRVQDQLTALQDQLAALQPAPDDCPAGWSRHGHSCYLIPSVTSTWLGAAVACPAIDSRARLASVHLTSSQHIEAMVADSDARYIWLGLVRLRSGGADWGWYDGTGLDYTNWAQGEPNNGSGTINEDCVCIRGPKHRDVTRSGEWHDGACNHDGSAYNFLCQIRVDQYHRLD